MRPFSASRTAVFGAALVAMLLAAFPSAGQQRGDAFRKTSLEGSGTATMQSETVPARVARVAVRPGTREAWALGTSRARVAGWDSSRRSGQVVFLHHRPDTGWVLVGPPKNKAGAVFNPVLAAFAIAPDGAGWAVGDRGVLLYKPPGSTEWSEHAQSGTLTSEPLTSISLADGAGYAVGFGPTILRLSGDRWASDPVPAEMAAQTSELTAVATVSADDAWAVATGQVTGVDSTSLLVYHRVGGRWERVTTGRQIFDSPPAKSADGLLNKAAEAGAVVANAKTVWVGGKMHPRSAGSPDGDSSVGDASRAFVLRIDRTAPAGGSVTTYCPDQYVDRAADGRVDLTRMCDSPFPTAPFHVASLSMTPSGDVFAGGLGLFRFDGTGWFREPNTNGYLISIAMAHRNEGWVASSGRSLGAGGLLRSDVTTIGHWTASPRRSAIARWPQPQDKLLVSVARAGDGSGSAIAVGLEGAAVINRTAAWDSVNPEMFFDLYGVAWPAGSGPWAVGQQGTILRLDGLEWKVVPSPVSDTLYAVAFRTAREGLAVGTAGTIIAYDGARWRDVTPQGVRGDLYAVAPTPEGWIAVGRDGTLVEGRPGAWRVRSDAAAMVARPDEPVAPSFYALTALPDGEMLIGGQDGSLLVRARDGKLRHFESPVEGTIVSLSATGEAIFASVSPNAEKYRGSRPAIQRGVVLRHRDGRWQDISLNRRITQLRDQVDSSAFDDPVYALDMGGAEDGWAVGGSPAEFKDETEGHFRSRMSSAIYRVRPNGDPSPPISRAAVDEPGNGVRFAVFGESWCGKGLCSSAMGTGTMADEVALKIRDEINAASLQPGGPKFVMFTGSMRRQGVPEELQQFRRYLQGFRIPVYGALGSRDLLGSLNASVSGSTTAASSDFWRAAFAEMPSPWGNGPVPPGIRPLTSAAPLDEGEARTHYAFDYLRGSTPVLRVVVVDSSTRSFGSAADQNPQEEQSTWLKATLAEASDVMRIPAVVIMNQPTVLPSNEQVPNWSIEAKEDFESTVVAARVSVVVTGGFRINAMDRIKATVPLYITGGGGAPLGVDATLNVERATKLPTDGYYHAWNMFDVDGAKRVGTLGLAQVNVTTFPVLESVAIHSFYGTVIPAGNTTDVFAYGRGLSGGFSDPEQAKASLLRLDDAGIPKCGYKSQGNGLCVSDAAMQPRVRFFSQDPEIADFVVRNGLNRNAPQRIDGKVVRDAGGLAGLLCTFKTGTARVNVVAGMHKSVMTIRVVGGAGPCVDARVPDPPEPTVVPTIDPGPEPEPERKPFVYFGGDHSQGAAALFPPIPAPVVAPAPPGAPGVGRKEEHEVQTETEGHGENEFRALDPNASYIARRQRAQADAAGTAGPILAGAVLAAFFGAATAAAALERRAARAEGRHR